MKQESLGKEIIRLALPATVENIFQTLVGFVDTLLIAQLGLVAVTAVGLANTILNVYLAVYMALGVGATALIARSIGAGDRETVAFHVRQALVLSVGVGLLFGLLSLIFGRQMLVLMGADAESLAGAQAFFYWVGGLTIFQSLMTILGTILRASGEWERTRLVKKEFVNKSLFLVVELKQSIPRLFHSHPRIAPTVRVVTVGG
ncbi:MATE family efflux transporter [Streptococcus suis]|nr:MATE family efflux transporter [Streptococcus suis]MDG4501074.1 MATE family efflux transporter [Streptococcus suis]